MTTARDICTAALKITGVLAAGQTAQAEDINDAFDTLRRMLGMWQSRRWLVPALAELSFAATGDATYSIGPGGLLNVLRPDRIDDAFVRLLGTSGPHFIDYPLQMLDSREDYNAISFKGMASFPQCIFYQPTSPVGTLYVWPVPSAQYEIHVFFKAVLSNLVTLDALLTLPAEYEEAILYNLVGRLCLSYRVPMEPAVASLAAAGLNTVRMANARVPQLALPGAVLGGRSGMGGLGYGGYGGWIGGVTGVSGGGDGFYLDQSSLDDGVLDGGTTTGTTTVGSTTGGTTTTTSPFILDVSVLT
jgi:hypothetical protein